MKFNTTFAKKNIMESAVFEIDKTTKGGQDLYDFLRNSIYARLIINNIEQEYTFYDLNESSVQAFADADADKTNKSKDLNDLFKQLEI